MHCTLILGGARSGKSAYAEQLAQASSKQVVYVATAAAGDGEMAHRIEHHRARRPQHWLTIEEELALASVLREHCSEGKIVLVDCMTLWLSNLMFCDARSYPDVGTLTLPPRWHQERGALLALLEQDLPGELVLVSNEVGMGIIPFGAITRTFADEAGRLNQALASVSSRVVLVAAGLPLTLKGATC